VRDALVRFVDELRRLRRLAGSPSLNRLVALSIEQGRALPRSTISDKLAAKSLPDWDFVASFVTACVVHAEKMDAALPAELADLSWWDTAHLRMLRDLDETRADQRLTVAARAEIVRRTPARAGPQRVVPRQLPAAVRHFAGRSDELARLSAAMDRAADATGTVVVTAVGGTAGIGKTAMAVHWAHQVAESFTDGQLYANLRGFDPTGSIMTPSEAVRNFLDAFQVPADQIPVSLDAQAALYRSLVAGRRILIVLDNALDADQVRALLPGSSGCLVVVTSRHRLSSLVAVEGAHQVTLDLLSTADARALLAGRIGRDRVAAEPRAVDEIVARCARLPLALSIVAARATAHPSFSLAALAAQLREAQGGLDAFDGDDPAIDLRSVLSWSYELLKADVARLFRLVALHAGPDITAPAAASLAAIPLQQARRRLVALARAHLVDEHLPGRFTFHDLLRAYATELAERLDTETERRAAVRRVLEHYVHTGYTAALLLDPHRDVIAIDPPAPDVVPEHLDGPRQATEWFTAEHAVLVAAIRLAACAGFETHAWQLPWTARHHFKLHGHWHDWVTMQTIGLAVAERLGDPAAEAHAARGLAGAYAQVGRYDEAEARNQRALDLFGALDDRPSLGHAHLGMSWIHGRQHRYTEALRHAEQALADYRAAGHLAGQAKALNTVGWYQAFLGEHERALACCREALALQQRIGDRFGEPFTLDSVGYAHHRLGRHRDAIACYHRAVELFREIDDQFYTADTLVHLGDAYEAAGEVDASRTALERALAILDRLQHPDAGKVRARLERHG
jgi:tetratricopeptide (TPR) repeat protein